jgi:hypothetical protein
MRVKNNWFHPGLLVWWLALSMTGCASTTPILIDDSANIRKHEQSIMVPEPSGQDTNRELRMDMEGGG